jgi:hypothetical protein
MSRSLLFILVACLLPTAALANDGVVNELGTGIAPLNATEVRLEREVVVFTEVGRRFAVTADLHFRNPTKKTQTLRLGFPADYEQWGDGDSFIADLAVWVDGTPAALKLVPVGAPLGDQPQAWTRMYTFEVTFPPDKEVQILHQYTIAPAGDSMAHDYLTYVFVTGATWGGTVGEARFVFRFDRPPIRPRLSLGSHFVAGVPRDGKETAHLDSVRCAVPGEAGGTVASSCHYEYVAGPTPTLSLVLRDVEPKADVQLQWGGVDALNGVPQIGDDQYGCVYSLISLHRSLSPALDWPEIGVELKECYDPAVVRNFLFAGRGYAFTSDRYRKMFYGVFHTSDAAFDATWMSGRENWMIEQLKGLESKK